MIAIVQPAPFSSCLGFDGPRSAGRAHYGVYGKSGGLAPQHGARCRTQLPHYISIRPPAETDDISPVSYEPWVIWSLAALWTENRMGEPA